MNMVVVKCLVVPEVNLEKREFITIDFCVLFDQMKEKPCIAVKMSLNSDTRDVVSLQLFEPRCKKPETRGCVADS